MRKEKKPYSKKNNSILQCPSCEKPLINIASKVERIHPVAKFIDDYNLQIVVIFGLSAAVALVLLIQLGMLPFGRDFIFFFFAILFLPSTVMYFLLRCFSLYRVTKCPYCSYQEQQKLGRSSTA